MFFQVHLGCCEDQQGKDQDFQEVFVHANIFDIIIYLFYNDK